MHMLCDVGLLHRTDEHIATLEANATNLVVHNLACCTTDVSTPPFRLTADCASTDKRRIQASLQKDIDTLRDFASQAVKTVVPCCYP